MLQTTSRMFSSEALEEAVNQASENGVSGIQSVERVFAALERMEALVANYVPSQRQRESETRIEITRLQQENGTLRADRQELMQAIKTLKNQNDTLSFQIDEISERLDNALEKIGLMLEE